MFNPSSLSARGFRMFGLILTLLAGVQALQASPQPAAELDITPDTFYELSFEASGITGQAQATIQMRDAQGLLPYDGVLTGSDYRLTPDQSAYRYAFLSASQGVKLRLLVDSDGVTVSQVSLKPIKSAGMILNGDLSLPGFIGWPVRSNAVERVTDKDKPAIRINTNNYALSEFIPITPGAGYRYIKNSHSWPGVTILAYDRNKRFIRKLSNDFRAKPPIATPASAAYLRLVLHTSHDHIPTHATVHFTGAGLEQVSEPQPADASKQQPAGREAFAEIILAPGSDGREELAARELQYWIAQITGATPPVLAEPSPLSRVKLHVGKALAGRFADDLQSLKGTDGYAVRRDGQDIYIFGDQSRGSLYGVYALLERNTDIIWPRPNGQMEAVFSTQDGIAFNQADFLSKPAFWHRDISNSSGYVFQRWFARNGLNTQQTVHGGFDYVEWMFGSNVGYGGSFLGWARPGANDQDMYPLVDGVRSISRWRQPCMTHPQLVPRIVEHIRQRFRTLEQAGIEADYLHITLADNWTVCSCDRCMTPIDLPDGSKLSPKAGVANKDPLFFSTRVFLMLNQVAEELSKDHPNLKIQTHAYIFTAEPPRVKLHPNIIPQYAAYPTQNVRYPIMAEQGNAIDIYQKDTWKRRFLGWRDMNVDLGYFGYYYVSGYNALADTAAADYRDLLKFGGVQAHTEGFPLDTEALTTWDVDAIEKWAIARLMWDPNQDPDALRQQYIQRVYHEAAPAMTQFHKLIQQAWHAIPESVSFNCHTAAQVVYEEMILKQDLEEKLRNLLVQAQQSAKHPVSRMMVDRQLAKFDDFKKRFGQHPIPYVEESRNEWLEAASPHWEKALALGPFKMVDDWRSFNKKPAPQQTVVALMHDRKNLYVRFTAKDDDLASLVMPAQPVPGVGMFPQGDRVELMLRVNGKNVYYITAGPNGTLYSLPTVKGQQVAHARAPAGDAWVAIIAIPLEAIQWSADQPAIELMAGRVYRHDPSVRLESTLSGANVFNKADVLWTKLAIEP